MKKKIFIFLSLFVYMKNMKSQFFGDEYIQTRGTNVFNISCGYGGLPNEYKTHTLHSISKDVFVKPGIHYGLSYERLIFNKVGLGIEINRGSASVNFKSPDITGNIMYNYKYLFTTVRAMVKVNYHLFESEDFDVYVFGAGGYKFSDYKLYTNDEAEYNRSISKISPFALKAGLGGRYFFTNNFGLNLEAAFGSPYISAGISYKFLAESDGGSGFTFDLFDGDEDDD
jgi:hypothetical protein